MIVVLCEHCHQQIQVGEDALGRQVRCPLCGQTGTAALAAAEPIEEIDDTGEGLIPLADDDGTITPFSDEQAAADEQLLRDDPLAALMTPGTHRRRPRRAEAKEALANMAPDTGGADPLAALAGSDSSAAADDAVFSPASPAAGQVAPSPAPVPPARAARSIDWFIVSGDYEYGPFRPEEIAAGVRAGRISPGITLRAAFGERSITAGQLMRHLERSAPPPTNADDDSAPTGPASATEDPPATDDTDRD